MIITNKFFKKIVQFGLALLLVILVGCENNELADNTDSINQNQLSKLVTTYNLKVDKINNEINTVKFNTIEEAETFLNQLKNSKAEKSILKFDKNNFKKSFSIFSSSKNKKAIIPNQNRLRTGWTEQGGGGYGGITYSWFFNHLGGGSQLFYLNFQTDSDKNIYPFTIVHTKETSYGSSTYQQGVVTMIDGDSFTIAGTLTFPFSINGAPNPYSYNNNILTRVDIDWSSGTVIFTETFA